MSYKSWYEISLSEFLAWHSLSYIVHLSIIQVFIACIILIKLGGKVLIFLEFTVTFPVYVFLNRFSFLSVTFSAHDVGFHSNSSGR